MFFRPRARAISSSGEAREGFEQFALFGFRDGAEVEDEAVFEDARDDGRRLSAEALVEGVGRVLPVREGDECGRRVRGRGRAAADGRLAVDYFKAEPALAQARARAACEGAGAP